jgi:uncharacterized membrane protein required for colicin V production
MGLSLILDIATLAILGAAVFHGWKKGLIHSVAGVLATVIAAWAAWLLANALAQPFAAVIQPYLEPTVTQALEIISDNDDVLPNLPGAEQTDALFEATANALKEMGFAIGLTDTFVDAVMKNASETGASLKETLANSVYRAIAFSAVLVFGFIVMRALLEIAASFVSKLFTLPGLNTLNKLGGCGAGFVSGIIFMLTIGWAARFAGSVIPAEAVEGTVLFKIFAGAELFNNVTGAILSRI